MWGEGEGSAAKATGLMEDGLDRSDPLDESDISDG